MAGRWAVYLPLLGVYGAIGLRLLQASSRRLTPVRDLKAELARFACIAALLLLAALLLRAVFQSVTVWGLEEALAWDNLRALALDSRWGGRWRWQAAAGGVCAFGFVVALGLPAVGQAIGWVGALGVAATLPMTGHAFGDATLWTAQSLHVLAAGLWIGTLAVLLGMPHLASAIPAAEAASLRRFWLFSFAPLAVTAALLLVLSGFLLAWRYVPDWGALLTEPWGRMLAIKAALSLVVVVLGAVSHRRLRRSADPYTAPPPASAVLELLFALLALVATGVLTSTAQPHLH